MLIRDALITDHHSIFQLIEQNWDSEIASKAIKEFDEMFFSNSKWPPHYYVAEDENGQVVGCGGYKSAWLMSNTYELIWVNVKQEFRGQGIGRALTQHRIDRIKELGGTLILLMTKTKQRFFESFGF